MTFEENLEDWYREFELKVTKQQGNNSFVRTSWHIADPHQNGLSFEVSTNDDGDISILSSDDLFHFGSLNIAETLAQELMNDVVVALLSGSFTFRTTPILRLPLLIPRSQLTEQAAWLSCSPWLVLRRTSAKERAAEVLRGY